MSLSTSDPSVSSVSASTKLYSGSINSIRLLAGELIHRAPTAHDWWRSAVIYQVYPRSFADANGDGVGDLDGIRLHLSHLQSLGVDAIWLSPFYPSPQNDGGYDVSDYCNVDPIFGTLEDFDLLLQEAHQHGLRVLVDVVPNHTSDQHSWFRAALSAGENSTDREKYMFRPGKGKDGNEPPNNWRSIFGGSAWTQVCQRPDAPGSAWENDRSWYLNLFDSSQPDLNWNNLAVQDIFSKILRFWLDRGVDGFRIDVAHGLMKADNLPDWDYQTPPNPVFDQESVHQIYQQWHKVLEEYSGEKILVAEAWVHPLERLANYVRQDEMHQAFNFAFLNCPWESAPLKQVIDESYRTLDAVGAPSTWVLSNHDVVRHASRFGLADTSGNITGLPGGIGAGDPQPNRKLGIQKARSATLLMLALPGSAYLYQGEEIGLPEHTTLPDSIRQDPTHWRTKGKIPGRDGCRVPLPWKHNLPTFGYSPTGKSWLPQPEDWSTLAVDLQSLKPESTLNLYRQAISIRKKLNLGLGNLQWLKLENASGEDTDTLAFWVYGQTQNNQHSLQKDCPDRALFLCLTTFAQPISISGIELMAALSEVSSYVDIPSIAKFQASHIQLLLCSDPDLDFSSYSFSATANASSTALSPMSSSEQFSTLVIPAFTTVWIEIS